LEHYDIPVSISPSLQFCPHSACSYYCCMLIYWI